MLFISSTFGKENIEIWCCRDAVKVPKKRGRPPKVKKDVDIKVEQEVEEEFAEEITDFTTVDDKSIPGTSRVKR